MNVVGKQLNHEWHDAAVGGQIDQGVVDGKVDVPVGVEIVYGFGRLHEPVPGRHHPFPKVFFEGIGDDQVAMLSEMVPLFLGKGREIHDILSDTIIMRSFQV